MGDFLVGMGFRVLLFFVYFFPIMSLLMQMTDMVVIPIVLTVVVLAITTCIPLLTEGLVIYACCTALEMPLIGAIGLCLSPYLLGGLFFFLTGAGRK